jgi:ATP-dependent DNA helicase RecQ
MTTPVAAALDRARCLLQRHFGYSDFRPAQRRVVQSVLAGRDVLAVLPTGAGKSVCFQVPALALEGLTVVVSPLISLMQDQVLALRSRGIGAELLNSTLDPIDQERVIHALRERMVRLLYLSPERLGTLAPQLRHLGIRPVRLVIDEAHCVDEWGYDFRPSYRRLGAMRKVLGAPPVAALTGSATPEARHQIQHSLGLRRPDLLVGSFDRPNLWFGVVPVGDPRDRLRRLIACLRGGDRIAIVYAPTRNLTEALVRALRREGFLADPYHAGLSRRERALVLNRFLTDEIEIVVATSAFGMGIDKPNVRMVMHWMLPASPEAYYQEAGRAGRDGELARCLLLHRPGDTALHRKQLDVTFPPRRLLERIWRMPGARERTPRNVLASADRLARELRPGQGLVDWTPVEARRSRAEGRIRAMDAYAQTPSCRRHALVGYFGERLGNCSGCDRCGGRNRSRLQDAETEARLARLHRALAGRTAPWGGAVLEPDVLLRLARRPPGSGAELAATPGVGPIMAEQLGRVILDALQRRPDGAGDPVPDPRAAALRNWRARTARELGVPDFVVLGDDTLAEIRRCAPTSRRELSRVRGIGPRFLAKWGAEVMALVRAPSGNEELSAAGGSLPAETPAGSKKESGLGEQ